ncbi:MAG: hypothetical protein J3K34DRAFT_408686 [Monoraphidium minutum]|nr:MAG: hypothetical protein J3K34DRAFT_408686 [Monoraphidium minutum]
MMCDARAARAGGAALAAGGWAPAGCKWPLSAPSAPGQRGRAACGAASSCVACVWRAPVGARFKARARAAAPATPPRRPLALLPPCKLSGGDKCFAVCAADVFLCLPLVVQVLAALGASVCASAPAPCVCCGPPMPGAAVAARRGFCAPCAAVAALGSLTCMLGFAKASWRCWLLSRRV